MRKTANPSKSDTPAVTKYNRMPALQPKRIIQGRLRISTERRLGPVRTVAAGAHAPYQLFVSEGLIVCPTPGRMRTSFAGTAAPRPTVWVYDGGLAQGGLNRDHHARDGFREKTTGPAFRLNTAAVSPSQPGVCVYRLARAESDKGTLETKNSGDKQRSRMGYLV